MDKYIVNYDKMGKYSVGDIVIDKRNGREYQITGFKTFVIGDKEESYVYLSFSGGKTQYGGEYLNLFFDNFEVKIMEHQSNDLELWDRVIKGLQSLDAKDENLLIVPKKTMRRAKRRYRLDKLGVFLQRFKRGNNGR